MNVCENNSLLQQLQQHFTDFTFSTLCSSHNGCMQEKNEIFVKNTETHSLV
jgi:hypothetical protein